MRTPDAWARGRLTIKTVDLSKDRFRTLAYKHAVLDAHDHLYYVFVGDVRKLLVREHRAIERLVRRMIATERPLRIQHSVWTDGYLQGCTDILAALRRRRG